jgi:hypothetical protein
MTRLRHKSRHKVRVFLSYCATHIAACIVLRTMGQYFPHSFSLLRNVDVASNNSFPELVEKAECGFEVQRRLFPDWCFVNRDFSCSVILKPCSRRATQFTSRLHQRSIQMLQNAGKTLQSFADIMDNASGNFFLPSLPFLVVKDAEYTLTKS